MDSKVKNFIKAIISGVNVKTAISNTGVGEMNTHDVLDEIAKEFK